MEGKVKCLCGYEYDYKYEEGEMVVLKGDDEFIEVSGNFTRTEKYDYDSDEIIYVSVHACPKCKTLQIGGE